MSFHFLRPDWLWLLPLVALAALVLWRRHRSHGEWTAVIDPKLQPHVLASKPARGGRRFFLIWLLAAVLVVIALAGPAWQNLPTPVYRQQSALVIAFDLSRSMNAQDLAPSRLARARLKLIDILNQRNEGQTALLAYAATAYTITPLTDDVATIRALVSSLNTDLMPAQGSRPDRALRQAEALLRNSGITRGHIVFITDGIGREQAQRMQGQASDRHAVSILSVASREGAPVPATGGGFIKDGNGAIVVAKPETATMRNLAQSLGGVYQDITVDDQDIRNLHAWMTQSQLAQEHATTEFNADRWREEGPWLLLLVAPLVAVAFRRGMLLAWLPVVVLLHAPPLPPQEGDSWWQRLWFNHDQRGHEALEQGNNQAAAALFRDQRWKAAAQYRSGRFEEALQQYEGLDSTEDAYNRANTLARMGQLQQALQEYDAVLEQDPDHADAAYNRDIVEQALKQQQAQADADQQPPEDAQQSPSDQQAQTDDQQNQQQSESDQASSAEQAQPTQSQSQQSPDSREQAEQSTAQEDSEQQSESMEQQPQAQAEDQRAEANQEAMSQSSQAEMQDREQDMNQQAEAQWLRRIPDDPGGLLRNKFRYQYSREAKPEQEKEPW